MIANDDNGDAIGAAVVAHLGVLRFVMIYEVDQETLEVGGLLAGNSYYLSELEDALAGVEVSSASEWVEKLGYKSPDRLIESTVVRPAFLNIQVSDRTIGGLEAFDRAIEDEIGGMMGIGAITALEREGIVISGVAVGSNGEKLGAAAIADFGAYRYVLVYELIDTGAGSYDRGELIASAQLDLDECELAPVRSARAWLLSHATGDVTSLDPHLYKDVSDLYAENGLANTLNERAVIEVDNYVADYGFGESLEGFEAAYGLVYATDGQVIGAAITATMETAAYQLIFELRTTSDEDDQTVGDLLAMTRLSL